MFGASKASGGGGGGGSGHTSSEHLLDRYRDKINLSSLDDKAMAGVVKHTGRDDRATSEQVLDPRTRLILFKLLSREVFTEIHGCVSTGKEANVYHAFAPQGKELALKIYKTSILVFKDRDRYVSGEFRFLSGYAKGNPRKMVKVWAEKEMRNLRRLNAAGIPSPVPILLRMHVLLMEFIGHDGVAAPRLRDAQLSPARLATAYEDVVRTMRKLYQVCRLVHADLSEYNLLYHEGRVVVIDVSQSVEHDHPRSLEFLRMDCKNITDYFRRSGVMTIAPKDLFDFCVHASLSTPEDEQAFLDGAMARAESSASDTADERAQRQVDESVFMQAYIPQRLAAVRDAEAETLRVMRGDTEGMYYRVLSGMEAAPDAGAAQAAAAAAAGAATTVAQKTAAMPNNVSSASSAAAVVKDSDACSFVSSSISGSEDEGVADVSSPRAKRCMPTAAPAAAGTNGAPGAAADDDDKHSFLSSDISGSDSSSDGEGDEDDEDGEDDGRKPREVTSLRAMSKEERKAHKAAVKEEKREKRKTKIPKHVKKRHTKAGKK
jgi:RIO kinase 1